MPALKENPTLKNYQKYVEELVRERGFADVNVQELFMLLIEEVGEMAKAARKAAGMHIDRRSEEKNLAHEMADVLIYLFDIANRFKVDLEQAFREKEEQNEQRHWEKKHK
ncbi:MAG: MazG nucleotide pyrophosphohydrolase domain-containing protein [bacterium]|nr:MazG nucleotide pyrophosphohydrolase domain-containing protein [bacterium]